MQYALYGTLTLTLPNVTELQKEFGLTRNGSESPVTQGRVSVLYDIFNKLVIDSSLAPLSKSEGKLAIDHLEHTSSEDLIIYDRGYLSFDLVYNHFKRGVDFLFRARFNYNAQVKSFVQSDEQSRIIDLYPPKNKNLDDFEYSRNDYITVRLNKVILPNGTIEVLVSSLLDEQEHDETIFKELYFKRWKVAIYYDELKNKLLVGDFSGYSKQAILQDFYSAVFVGNIETLLTTEINLELAKNNK